MVKHRLNIARMVYRLEFGHEEPTGKINPNTGNEISGFKVETTRWAAKWSLTQYQQLKLAGSGIKNAMVFAIRHDPQITTDYLIQFESKKYIIDHILYDEGRTADAYDLITCHVEDKHG
ncbi:head-tail adaptor protein [Lactobacillus sp. PV037]|uniref:phage head closure protein n=1 Tax=Lactobacillus sp. PV037 TaxID=2594496 RepID=UPI00223FAB57|nr:phage head closure protein [Lactobacillus sp. PV037]QNQ83759.1 head-tail adaptor protein [Lactobacillus sp. PV037]